MYILPGFCCSIFISDFHTALFSLFAGYNRDCRESNRSHHPACHHGEGDREVG
jgi:hypothetical protein